jgi:cation-transporting ATPase 13A1
MHIMSALFHCPYQKNFLHLFLVDVVPFIQVMITGDQALTACHVAAQVHIVSQPVLILTLRAGDGALGEFDWLSPDEELKFPYKYVAISLDLLQTALTVVKAMTNFYSSA